MRNQLNVRPAPLPPRGSDLLSDLRVSGPQDIAYLLDFDGTLVELAQSPEAIRLAPDLTKTLLKLHETAKGAVAIITGRDRAFVLERLGTERVTVIGLHGAEEPGQPLALPPEQALIPARTYAQMTPGIVAEDKRGAFALHFRLAPHREAEVFAIMTAAAKRAGEGFRLKAGKSVWELCPATADKGAALSRLMSRPPFKGRLPLAIGDDLTDEAMFKAAKALGGYAALVGHGGAETGESSADYHLVSPAQVRALLKELAQ